MRLIWRQVSKTVKHATLPDHHYEISIRSDGRERHMSVWFKETPRHLGDMVLEFSVRLDHPDIADLEQGFCEKAWRKFQPDKLKFDWQVNGKRLIDRG